MRIDPGEFRACPLRVHALLHDVPLEDVWAVRLPEVAKTFRADAVVDVQKDDALAVVRDITGGHGVDVVIDCTAGAGSAPVLLGVEATKPRGGTMVIQGEGNQEFPNFPIGRVTRKGMTLKSARGHAFARAASGRFPLELMMTHPQFCGCSQLI